MLIMILCHELQNTANAVLSARRERKTKLILEISQTNTAPHVCSPIGDVNKFITSKSKFSANFRKYSTCVSS